MAAGRIDGRCRSVQEGLLLGLPCCCCSPELEKKGWSGDAGIEEGEQVVVGGRKIPIAEEVSLCWWRRELELQLCFLEREPPSGRERERERDTGADEDDGL